MKLYTTAKPRSIERILTLLYPEWLLNPHILIEKLDNTRAEEIKQLYELSFVPLSLLDIYGDFKSYEGGLIERLRKRGYDSKSIK